MDYVTRSADELRRELAASRKAAWVTAVIAPLDGDSPRVIALQAIVGPRPDIWQDRIWRYKQCAFIAGRSSAKRLATLLEGGAQMLDIGGVGTPIEFAPQQVLTAVHAPGLAEYSSVALQWPSFAYSFSFANASSVNAPQEYLVGVATTPSFPTFAAAYNAFFYGQYVVSGVGNPELGRAWIRVVDGRARIRRVRVRPASLDVWLAGSQASGAYLELNGQESRIVVEVDNPHVVIPLRNGLPSDAWLWLKNGREWLDFRSLTPWGGYLSSDIEFDLPRDPVADLSRLATQGEGLHLEYKEKLPDTRDQKRKVFKTAVAFANGAGGTIVFGVQDEGAGVVGVEGNEATQRRRLTDMVRDLVSPSPKVLIESARLDGRLVLVLHVQPGEAPSTRL